MSGLLEPVAPGAGAGGVEAGAEACCAGAGLDAAWSSVVAGGAPALSSTVPAPAEGELVAPVVFTGAATTSLTVGAPPNAFATSPTTADAAKGRAGAAGAEPGLEPEPEPADGGSRV